MIVNKCSIDVLLQVMMVGAEDVWVILNSRMEYAKIQDALKMEYMIAHNVDLGI